MKVWRKNMTKKELRREGRRVRKYQRLEKWLDSDACYELKVVEQFLYNGDETFPKVCTKASPLVKALVHAVPIEQLKKYTSLGDWWEKNELYMEIQSIISGKSVNNQVGTLIQSIKAKSNGNSNVENEILHEYMYDYIINLLNKYHEQPPEWMKYVAHGFYNTFFLHNNVSILLIPDLSNILKAACCMNHTTQVMELIIWDKYVRQDISDKLNLPIRHDNFIFDKKPIEKKDWHIIWWVIYDHLPNRYKSTIKPSISFKELSNNKEIIKLINDFDLKPV